MRSLISADWKIAQICAHYTFFVSFLSKMSKLRNSTMCKQSAIVDQLIYILWEELCAFVSSLTLFFLDQGKYCLLRGATQWPLLSVRLCECVSVCSVILSGSKVAVWGNRLAVDHAEMRSYPLLDLKWRRLKNYRRPALMWRSSGESLRPPGSLHTHTPCM